MANWCFNKVKFTGEQQHVNAVTGLFKLLEARQKMQKKFDVPDFMAAASNFRDVEVGNEQVYFRSKYRPDLETLKAIADHFHLGFTDRFEEPDTYIFGAASYREGQLQTINLENNDFAQIQYDRELKSYLLDGNAFDDELDAFDALLDKKLAQGYTLPPGHQR